MLSPRPSLEHIRHTLAHLVAHAVQDQFPQTKFAIGPTIADGFYYDLDPGRPLTSEDLKPLEKRVKHLIKQNLRMEEIPASDPAVKEYLAQQPFKQELLKEIEASGQRATWYRIGKFIDLCRGGHVENSNQINPDGVMLSHVAGAYWRGDSAKPMLQRIYGLAFETKEELSAELFRQAEAKRRDHKILGPQLGLFMFHSTAPGMPYWLPAGVTIYQQLVDFWRQEHQARNYQEISSPLVNKKELWETSGHWEHYRDNMFIADMGKDDVYGVKAMNCPNAMIVFGSAIRSYRDLPLRLSDTDTLHRYEASGTLNGLLRARSFRQDDSHNFITEDQIEGEYSAIMDIAKKFYGIFKLPFRYRLGTRPEKYVGEVATWDKAEKALRRILDRKVGQGKYEVLEGDGAFYGPKIDILMNDSIGREWQMGTIQLDFQQPQRFKLEYAAADGTRKTPVVVHRVIYGSLERFIGILIEHFAGAFPLWLAPTQVQVIPVAKKHNSTGKKLAAQLRAAGIRAQLDETDESVGYKIRKAEKQKAPYMVVVGDKEKSLTSLAIRIRGKKDVKQVKLKTWIPALQQAIARRVITL
jgi:threonyl-tRNA synthetase